MGKHSGIDYVDASWGPWEGCTEVSEGCRNCYARHMIETRFHKDFHTVRRTSDKTFYAPTKWEEPRRIFVCPRGDFFHEAADAWRGEALQTMFFGRQHTFIIPTKRTERIVECLIGEGSHQWHLSNVWILASVEDQATADKRIPELLQLREHSDHYLLGVSYEPALGPVDFYTYLHCDGSVKEYCDDPCEKCNSSKDGLLDWIVMGGESGPNARPMHPDWVRQTRDACVAAGVPFYLKQMMIDGKMVHTPEIDGREWRQLPEVGA